jgi:hypothetical protein
MTDILKWCVKPDLQPLPPDHSSPLVVEPDKTHLLDASYLTLR